MMSRTKEPVQKEEMVAKGRRPVGRAIVRDSNGRHGRGIVADITEEEGLAREPKGKAVIRAIGAGAAVVLFACGVGSVLVACSEGGGLKDPDAGMDTDTETDTGSEVDTDTGTGEEALVCEHHEGPLYDYEAKLAEGDTARLTVEGHEIELIVLDVGNQTVQVHVTDGEGNPILNGDSDFIFEGTETEITFDLDGEMVTLTLCWVVEVPEGADAGVEDAGTEGLAPGIYAKFITDGEHGFVHCEEADEYTSTETEYLVDVNTVQTITKTYYNEGETGDAECEGVTTEFHMEVSSFEAPLPIQENLPGGEDKSVKVRGATLNLLEVSFNSSILGARLGKQLASGNLHEDESVTGASLEVEYKGTGTSTGPDFAFKYPGIDEDTDLWVENTGDNEKTIYVLTSTDLLVFTLRFGNANWDGSIDVSLLKDVQRMENGTFTVGGAEYEVGMDVTPTEILGWTLTPVD